ncbi:MAG: hypothetical protein HY674_06385 [Chloroflexi bacterium]|nr:hypothetical protein [Chloroflexota bacterium]
MSKKRTQKTPTNIVFDTYAQASVYLNTPARLLKRAKRAGAPGFRHSRIFLAEVGPWLKEHAQELASPGERERLEIRRLVAQCQRLEYENSAERAKYISSEEAR